MKRRKAGGERLKRSQTQISFQSGVLRGGRGAENGKRESERERDIKSNLNV